MLKAKVALKKMKQAYCTLKISFFNVQGLNDIIIFVEIK